VPFLRPPLSRAVVPIVSLLLGAANGRLTTGRLTSLLPRGLAVATEQLQPWTGPLGRDHWTEYDVFHSPFFPLPPARPSTRIRRFLTVHDVIALTHPQFFDERERDIVRRIVRSIGAEDWVLADSRATKQDLCTVAGVDPSRVFVVPLAASTQLFYVETNQSRLEAVRTKYAIPEGPYVLSVNTLEPRKNIERSLRAFRRVVREEGVTDLSFVLVGVKGWSVREIERLTSELRSHQSRVIDTGYVPDEDLAALYSGSLAFIYPSLCEGFGLPPLEAMQCGVPVIASNTSSLPEVVGNAGILVEPTDETALAAAIFTIYANPSLRQELSVRSLARAKLFSWERCVQQTMDAYKVALAA
jgi:glycosyltransferase involved in cell wall biosynthesis